MVSLSGKGGEVFEGLRKRMIDVRCLQNGKDKILEFPEWMEGDLDCCVLGRDMELLVWELW